MPLLEFSKVSKSYGRGDAKTRVLVDTDLEIHEGEFVAIVGYSGAGKTTLISLLAGLISPDSGTVLFNGQPLTGPGPGRGIFFQNYSLFPWLTVHDNIQLAVDQLPLKLSAQQRR